MSTLENGANPVVLPQSQPAVMDVVSDRLSNLALQTTDPPKEPSPRPQNDPTSRPFIMYSRSQLLSLYKSPLVKIPNGMPATKDWFGYVAPYPHSVTLTQAGHKDRKRPNQRQERLRSFYTSR